MPGAGPAGKQNRSRARDNEVRDTVKSDGRLGGWALPEGVLGVDAKTGAQIEWHPQTVAWWDAWRASPQGTRMVTEPDWQFLLDTALMHHSMWANQRWDFAAEVRLRAAKFGATPEDRMRLKFEIAVDETFPVGATGTNGAPSTLERRRDSWGV